MDAELPGYCNEGIPVSRVRNEGIPVPRVRNEGIPVPRVLYHIQFYRIHIIYFRVRAWESYRTFRSSGYCGTSVHNSQKFRAGTKYAVPVPRVFVALAYRTYRSSGYGYECRTEFRQVPGTWMNVLQNLQKFLVGQYPGWIPPVQFLRTSYRTQPWKIQINSKNTYLKGRQSTSTNQCQPVPVISGLDTWCSRCWQVLRGTHRFQLQVLQVLWQVLKSFSASSTPGTGNYSVISVFGTPGTGRYSVISSTKYSRYWQLLNHFQCFRYWQVLRHFKLKVLQGLAGDRSVIFSPKYSRYWQVLSRLQLELLKVLTGAQIVCSFKYSRYWNVLSYF